MTKPTTLKTNCPHCKVINEAFSYRHTYTFNDDRRDLDVLWFACNSCQMPISLVIQRLGTHITAVNANRSWTRTTHDGPYRVIAMFPEQPEAGMAPDFTPDNIASFFNQGSRSLESGDFDLAGMGFRKAIDTATKKLIREINPEDLNARLGDTFVKRIEWLHSKGKLTEQIKDWSHIVRLEGNEAAHEEDLYKKEDAAQLQHFTEMFLQYVFTMPRKIQAYRNPSTD
ncbi:DUF4145 domain-containing protein [Hyphomicrobium sp. ghe19]|uniref:DUF4145 domain-containing protein n=1 Tax=Hyphomicrobium sp. ghe19 TaxID=2682968 RepID=UPI0013676810|nr:hypothetical protein HYPP_04377 [Hyphomicrobium sp. ghe19]